VRKRLRAGAAKGATRLASRAASSPCSQLGRTSSAASEAKGPTVRAGVHLGEVELVSKRLRGMAVDEAALILGQTGSGEIVVSKEANAFVKTLGPVFEDRGLHQLKGLRRRGVGTPRAVSASTPTAPSRKRRAFFWRVRSTPRASRTFLPPIGGNCGESRAPARSRAKGTSPRLTR
jgi:class 3 adenylate cyclase